MSVHMQREMNILNQSLQSLAGMVEQQVNRAIRALNTRDAELAITVRSADATIDQREIEVEEECLKALALYQPVASELRLVIATLKITNDLERIGDLAVNIAKKAEYCALSSPINDQPDLTGMTDLAMSQLRDAITSLIRQDMALAESVRTRDTEMNQYKKELRKIIENRMQQQPALIPMLLALLGAVRNLERIGDHATNIAEDVMYLAGGQIVRHSF